MRHIEKLKKIFTCCGKECSAETNGAALDELLTLAENGELGVYYETKSRMHLMYIRLI